MVLFLRNIADMAVPQAGPEAPVGSVGVSGRSEAEDEALALKAIGVLWSE